jgi:hypothetical protein
LQTNLQQEHREAQVQLITRVLPAAPVQLKAQDQLKEAAQPKVRELQAEQVRHLREQQQPVQVLKEQQAQPAAQRVPKVQREKTKEAAPVAPPEAEVHQVQEALRVQEAHQELTLPGALPAVAAQEAQ